MPHLTSFHRWEVPLQRGIGECVENEDRAERLSFLAEKLPTELAQVE